MFLVTLLPKLLPSSDRSLVILLYVYDLVVCPPMDVRWSVHSFRAHFCSHHCIIIPSSHLRFAPLTSCLYLGCQCIVCYVIKSHNSRTHYFNVKKCTEWAKNLIQTHVVYKQCKSNRINCVLSSMPVSMYTCVCVNTRMGTNLGNNSLTNLTLSGRHEKLASSEFI